MEEERPVTTHSAQLFPPPSPQEVAEAARVNYLTESETIAGLRALVVQGCEQQMKTSDRYLEDARKWSRDLLDTAARVVTTLQETNASALAMQKDHAAYMERARQPIQPRPTVAEATAETVQHLLTELRKTIKIAFSKDPELQGKAQRALDQVVEQGKELMNADAAGTETTSAPKPPDPRTSPGSASPTAPSTPSYVHPAAVPTSYSKEDVIMWMEVVGMPYCEKLFARFGITEPRQIQGAALAALHDAYKLLQKA